MLKQPIFTIFIRLLPEAFLFIYSIYRLTNTKTDFKKILISSFICGIGIYTIRLLPIHFGVHTIIAIMLYIFIAIKLNNIEIYKAITTVLLEMILLFMTDLTLILFYTKLFPYKADILFGQTWIASVSGLVSLFMFYLIISLICYIKGKRINYE